MLVLERTCRAQALISADAISVSSLQCLAAASTAFMEVERRLRVGGAARAALREELGACASLGRVEDRAELLGALQALVGGAVQYDGQAGAPLSVRQLCGLLQGGGNGSRPTPYRGLHQAVQVSSPGLAGGPADQGACSAPAVRPWAGESLPEPWFPIGQRRVTPHRGPPGGDRTGGLRSAPPGVGHTPCKLRGYAVYCACLVRFSPWGLQPCLAQSRDVASVCRMNTCRQP